ncbi:19608_t:CDS:2, partial [Gigaspora margarita]
VVIVTDEEYKMPKNLEKQLEKAIDDVKKSPEKLEEHREVKEYLRKIDKQLKNFNEKALKIDEFDTMINFKFEILFDLANLKTEIFSLTEKPNDLKNTCSNEINLQIGEVNLSGGEFDKINEFLFKWINCTKTIPFEKFYKDLINFSNFINIIEDSLFFFEIQEKLLDEITKVKRKYNKSKEINKQKKERWGILSIFMNTKEMPQNETYFSSSDIVKKLSDEFDELQSSKKLVESLKRNELPVYVKECCLDDVIENLTKIGCLVNNFCRQIVVEKRL